MFHKKLIDNFKTILRIDEKDIKEWFPNGRNSIRVVLNNGYQLILTYHSVNDWCVETRVSYENKLAEKSNLMRKAGK